MKRILLTILISFSISLSFSQICQWGFGLGGSNSDARSKSIVADAYGGLYIVGTYGDSIDFNPNTGVDILPATSTEMFISKYDSSGNYVWANHISAIVERITADSSGIYVTGEFNGTVDFDPGIGVANLNAPNGSSMFIAKYDTGGYYLWAKAINGFGTTISNDIKVDEYGNTYITGYITDSVDFDPSPSNTYLHSFGGSDIFLAKYDFNGNYSWAFNLGQTLGETGVCLSVSGSDIVLSGLFRNDTVDFDPGLSTANLIGMNGSIFIAKYDLNGNYINAVSIDGKAAINEIFSLKASIIGNIYTVGQFSDTVDFDPSLSVSNLIAPSNQGRIFYAKYDSNLNYVFAKSIENSIGGINSGYYTEIDLHESIYITGRLSGVADFDPSIDTSNINSNGMTDVFLAKYDSSGNYIWSFGIGSVWKDAGLGIALDNLAQIYLTGYYSGTMDVDPGPVVKNLSVVQANQESIFLAKYSNTVTNIFNEQANENITLSAYPNPSKETITIKTGRGTFIATSTLKIVNTLGETVYQKQIVNTQTPIQLDVSFLKAGLYLISLTSVKGTGHARLIKVE